MEQQSAAWFASRIGKITASCFAAVMAKPDTAAYQNYLMQIVTERLTGEPQGSDFQSADMAWGTAQEVFAKAAYEAHTGDLIEPCGLILHPVHAFAGASPDGLLGADGLIECKAPRSTTHVEYVRNKTLPAKYRAQVQGQLWATGRTWAHFISFDPRMPSHLQLLIVDVKRDEKYIETLEPAIVGFNAAAEKLLAELNAVREPLALAA